MEDFQEEDATVTFDKCGHTTHSACFFKYVQHEYINNKDVSCPLCRSVVIDKPVCVNITIQPEPAVIHSQNENGLKVCLAVATSIMLLYMTGAYVLGFT
jgi:hypothetical protein